MCSIWSLCTEPVFHRFVWTSMIDICTHKYIRVHAHMHVYVVDCIALATLFTEMRTQINKFPKNRDFVLKSSMIVHVGICMQQYANADMSNICAYVYMHALLSREDKVRQGRMPTTRNTYTYKHTQKIASLLYTAHNPCALCKRWNFSHSWIHR